MPALSEVDSRRVAVVSRVLFSISERSAKPIQSFHVNPERGLIAVALKNDKNVSVWSLRYSSRTSAQYKLACVLRHTRSVIDVMWVAGNGGGDEEQSTSKCLSTRTADGCIRNWSTAVDDEERLSLVLDNPHFQKATTSLHRARSQAKEQSEDKIGRSVSASTVQSLPDLTIEALHRCIVNGTFTKVIQRFGNFTEGLNSNHAMSSLSSWTLGELDTPVVAESTIDTSPLQQYSTHLGDSQNIERAALMLKQTLDLCLTLDSLGSQLDVNAQRYLLELAHPVPSAETGESDCADIFSKTASRRILWAMHSSTQEALLSHLEITEGGSSSMRWNRACDFGVFVWLRSTEKLKALAEEIGRTEYSKDEQRDPTWSSIIFLALGKVALVRQLWRQAVWHPEHHKMLRFLQNDFSEAKWKTAAQKNAFTLLSQRRFHLAIAFFLLSSSLEEAVSVCVRNLQDIHLAITISRLWSDAKAGQSSLELVVQQHVLPHAANSHDRCRASWGSALIGEYSTAVQAFSVEIPSMSARSDLMGVLDQLCSDGSQDDVVVAILLMTSEEFVRGILSRLPSEESNAIFAKLLQTSAAQQFLAELTSDGEGSMADAIVQYKVRNSIEPVPDAPGRPDPSSLKETLPKNGDAPAQAKSQGAAEFDFASFDF